MNPIKQFDIATAALEHLELLNQTNQNPLEIAAQFRILLRSKKEHTSDINSIPIDNTTIQHSYHPSKFQNINSINQINDDHYPSINWKQLRQTQYQYKLKEYFSTKFQPKISTSISNKTESYIYSNRSLSPSTIRTPSISPIHFPQSTYTISKLNSTIINTDEIYFPIADCNIIIKHKPKEPTHFEDFFL